MLGIFGYCFSPSTNRSCLSRSMSEPSANSFGVAARGVGVFLAEVFQDQPDAVAV